MSKLPTASELKIIQEVHEQIRQEAARDVLELLKSAVNSYPVGQLDFPKAIRSFIKEVKQKYNL